MVRGGENSRCRTPFSCFVVPIVRADDDHKPEAVSVLAPLPLVSPNFDKVAGRRVYEPGKKPQYVIEGESGLDRVKTLFTTDVYGVLGPEWTLIMHATYGGFVGGAIIGGLQGAQRAKDSFLARNQASIYHTELHAKRALQDRITLGMFSGATKFGLKMGAFSFLYVFNTTLFSVYRGTTSFVDFIASGFLTGFLWRFTMGPRAALVSSILGGVLGIFAGGCTSLAFYLTGTSMEELRYWHYYSLSKSLSGKATDTDEEPSKVSAVDVVAIEGER